MNERDMTLIRYVRYILLSFLCVMQISQPAFCENPAEVTSAKNKLNTLGREAIDSLAVKGLAGTELHAKFIELYKSNFAQTKIASLILGTSRFM